MNGNENRGIGKRKNSQASTHPEKSSRGDNNRVLINLIIYDCQIIQLTENKNEWQFFVILRHQELGVKRFLHFNQELEN